MEEVRRLGEEMKVTEEAILDAQNAALATLRLTGRRAKSLAAARSVLREHKSTEVRSEVG